MVSNNSRPYAVIAALPGHRPQAIARTCHKADADHMARFLNRCVPQGNYYVIFDPDETEQPPADRRDR